MAARRRRAGTNSTAHDAWANSIRSVLDAALEAADAVNADSETIVRSIIVLLGTMTIRKMSTPPEQFNAREIAILTRAIRDLTDADRSLVERRRLNAQLDKPAMGESGPRALDSEVLQRIREVVYGL